MSTDFENVLSWLNEEEKRELAMLIGMVELDLDYNNINFSRIVRIAYSSYVLYSNPEFLYF